MSTPAQRTRRNRLAVYVGDVLLITVLVAQIVVFGSAPATQETAAGSDHPVLAAQAVPQAPAAQAADARAGK